MKTASGSLLATLLVIATSALAQQPKGPMVKMAQIRSSAPLPADVPFDVKPMGYEPGFEIGYVVKGEGLASVKKDSLVMDHILTREGVNLAASRAGQPGYEMGAFPKVSEDGRYASFSVKVNQDAFGKVESLAMKGRITLLMATQRETASATLATAGGESVQAGPFTVAIHSGNSEGMGGAFFGGGQFGVQVSGPCDSLIDLKLLDGGRATESEGTMTSGNGPTVYFFPKPTHGPATVQIHYWTDMKEQKVLFGR